MKERLDKTGKEETEKVSWSQRLFAAALLVVGFNLIAEQKIVLGVITAAAGLLLWEGSKKKAKLYK